MRRPVEVGRRRDLNPSTAGRATGVPVRAFGRGRRRTQQRDERYVDPAAGGGRGGGLRAAPGTPGAAASTNCSTVPRCRLRDSQIDRAGRTEPTRDDVAGLGASPAAIARRDLHMLARARPTRCALGETSTVYSHARARVKGPWGSFATARKRRTRRRRPSEADMAPPCGFAPYLHPTDTTLSNNIQ